MWPTADCARLARRFPKRVAVWECKSSIVACHRPHHSLNLKQPQHTEEDTDVSAKTRGIIFGRLRVEECRAKCGLQRGNSIWPRDRCQVEKRDDRLPAGMTRFLSGTNSNRPTLGKSRLSGITPDKPGLPLTQKAPASTGALHQQHNRRATPSREQGPEPLPAPLPEQEHLLPGC